MYAIHILQCEDQQLWYRGMIGKIVPLVRDAGDCWMSREKDGYLNIVKKADAKLIKLGHLEETGDKDVFH
jgi:hypothetical protein